MTSEVYLKECANCGRTFKTEEDFLRDTSRWCICSAGNLWFNCSCDSTLVLPKGKYSWYNPSTSMTSEAKRLFNRLPSLDQWPYISAQIMKIQQLLKEKDTATEDLAKAFRLEPMLSLEVLKQANLLKNIRNPDNVKIRDLNHAIMYLGKKELSSLVMVASMKKLIFKTSIFKDREFWSHAFLSATIAEILMPFFPRLEADKLYLSACLADLGKILCAYLWPQEVDKASQYLDDPSTKCSWTRAELEFSLPDHCILGEIAATLWGLPLYIVKTIRWHHLWPKSSSPFEPEIVLVSLAKILAHHVSEKPHRINPDTLAQIQALKGWTPHDLAQWGDQLKKDLDERKILRSLETSL